MDSINTTDIAVASSPGANVSAVTLVYMCQMFGFMKALLQEEGVSTDSAIVSDSDTIAQREKIFSDADCEFYYNIKSYYYLNPDCQDNSMSYVTDPMWLEFSTACITYHFMTEMGANNSCSDDSVRSDINTTFKNTVTLLSKDILFYNFLVDTLNAGNICEATNDTITVPLVPGNPLPFGNCEHYITLKLYATSEFAYDTQRIDGDRQIIYSDCLLYRFLKSVGADNVCRDNALCSLFGFMKEWLQEEGVSTDSTIVSDSDTIGQRENMFSGADCGFYYKMSSLPMPPLTHICSSMWIRRYVDHLYGFSACITYHFMTEMGANNSCSDDSVRFNVNTTVKNTMTLSKDRHFYNFMANTLDARNSCQAWNDTGTLSAYFCAQYLKPGFHPEIKDDHAESNCVYNPQRIDIDSELSLDTCVYFRFMKSLDPESLC